MAHPWSLARIATDRLSRTATDDAVETLAQEIRVLVRSPDYRAPMLPTVAFEVQRLASSPVTTFSQVAQILEKDPLLTADVLRLARSPAYSRSTSVRSIREAVGRIGLKSVVDMVWQAAVETTFRSIRYGRPMEQVRRHSVATAHLSRAAALFTGIPAESAFLAGLLHDIGVSAALIVLGKRPGNVPERWEIEAASIAAVHEELSATVARAWRLPEDVQFAIGQHHRLDVGQLVHPLAAVVYVAEHLARKLGGPAGPLPPAWDRTDEGRLSQACQVLELMPPQLEVVEAEARKALAVVERT